MANKSFGIILSAQDKVSGVVRGMTRNVGDGLDTMGTKIKNVGTSFGASRTIAVASLAAMAVAIGNVIKNAANLGDQIYDISKRFGVSSEFASRFGFVMQQNGASIQTLTDSLRGFSRAMVTNEAKLNAIGVETRDSTGAMRDMEDVYRDTISAVSGLSSSAEKAAASQVLFGRSGSDLLQILEMTSEEISSAEKRADELGITMSRETTVAANEFNNKMAELGATMDAFKLNIVTEILPVLSDLQSISASVTSKFGHIIDAANKIIKYTDPIKLGFMGIKNGLSAISGAIDEPSDKMEDMAGAMELVNPLADEQAGKVRNLADAWRGLGKEADSAKKKIQDAMREEDKWRKAGSGEVGKEFGDNLKKEQEAQERLDKFFEGAEQNKTDLFRDHQKQRDDLAEKMTREQIERQEKQQQATEDNLAMMERASQDAGRAMSQGVGAAFEAMVSGSGDAKQAIISSVISAAETTVMSAAAAGAAEGGKSVSGIPYVGPILAPIAAAAVFGILRGFMSRIPKAATGGIIASGSPGVDNQTVLAQRGEGVLKPGQTQVMQRLADAAERGGSGGGRVIVNIDQKGWTSPGSAGSARAAKEARKQLKRLSKRGY